MKADPGALLALTFAGLAGALFFAAGETEPPPHPAVKPGSKSALAPQRSRFYGRIIDVHTHVHPASLDDALRILDERGIQRAVNLLPISYGPAWPVIQEMEKRARGRLLHFVSPDWPQLMTAPEDFGAKMAINLEAAVKAGARGLKIPKALGLSVPAPEGGLLDVDDPRLDPLWAKAGELGVPVAIHIGDPVAFWDPPGPDNERYDELKENPEWSNFGKAVPSHDELMAAQRRLFARHPGTTFIAVHVAGFPENLEWVDALLDELPHVYVDIAARIPELGHHPTDKARAFFLKHQDRVLFGTDLGVSPGSLMLGAPLAWRERPEDVDRFYRSTWRYLETDHERFEHPTPIQGRWKISGLNLPDEVLEKLYFKNAEKLLRLRAR